MVTAGTNEIWDPVRVPRSPTSPKRATQTGSSARQQLDGRRLAVCTHVAQIDGVDASVGIGDQQADARAGQGSPLVEGPGRVGGGPQWQALDEVLVADDDGELCISTEHGLVFRDDVDELEGEICVDGDLRTTVAGAHQAGSGTDQHVEPGGEPGVDDQVCFTGPSMPVPRLRLPGLIPPAGVVAGFTDRHGGVGARTHAGPSCQVSDDALVENGRGPSPRSLLRCVQTIWR